MALKRKVAKKDATGKVIPGEFTEEEITPAQQEARIREGQAAIAERERIASQLVEQGGSAAGSVRRAAEFQTAQMEAARQPMTPEEMAQLQGLAQPEFPELSVIERNARLEREKQEEKLGKQPLLPGITGGTIFDITPELSKNLKGAFADTIDVMRRFFTGGKPLKVQVEENSFNSASSAIASEIELMRNGKLSELDVLKDFKRAFSAINQLESSTKLLNNGNVRYFLDDGMEILTLIEEQRALLEVQRQDLLAAMQEARLKKAQAGFQQNV